MGCAITMDDSLSLEELREEIDDLRQLVKTLLTIIMEEADGVQTGSAPQFLISQSADIVCDQYSTGSGSTVLHMKQQATVRHGFHFSEIAYNSSLDILSPELYDFSIL